MNKKHAIALALVVGILMGLLVGMFFRPPEKLSVWGVSQVNLIKEGEPKNGRYVGAVWRVIGDTMYMNVSTAKFDQKVVQAVNPSALSPKGVAVNITGRITFRVWQSSVYPPYWEVPFIKVNDKPILVAPKTYGIEAYYDYWNLYGYKPILDKHTEPLYVDVYTLDWSNARLHIPFFFQAAKDGVGYLVPNKYTQKILNTYLIDICPSQLGINQNVTADIILTNPKDDSEWMKIHIIFPIVIPEYIDKPFAADGFLTIQPPNGGVPVSPSNTFIGKANEVTGAGGTLYAIFNGWTPGNYNPWAYYWYWFGDSSGRKADETMFKGNAILWIRDMNIPSCYYENFPRWGEDAGEANETTAACIWGYWGKWWLLSEGQMIYGDTYGAGPKSQVFDYPGWYHNFSDPDGWRKLYPIQPQLYYSYPEVDDPLKEPKYGTKPEGLSLCDYIRATYVKVPQKATLSGSNYTSSFSLSSPSPKPSLKPISCLNPYNPGLYAGGVPEVTNFVAHLPLAGASWAVWIDISSELADAIVITENYLNVQIQNFRISNNEIQPGSSVTLTMDLVNKLNIPGYINLEITCRESIQYQVSGTGIIDFSANEIKKDYRVYIYNTLSQTISQKITGHFTLAVWNGEQYTSSVNFELTFYPGAQLPNTGISVRCVNKNNPSEGIQSISITIIWGTSKERVARGVTVSGGYASIPLPEPYEGKIDIYASDNYLRFHPANLTDQYVSPTKKNEFTIEMTPLGKKEEFDLLEWLKQNMPYIIGGSIGAIGIAVGAYAVKRRREVWY
jgi:hypothetical protein